MAAELVIRISGPQTHSQQLRDSIRNSGAQIKRSGDKLYVFPNLEHSGSEGSRYSVPPGINSSEYLFMINASEGGGNEANKAYVVAGRYGVRLTPFAVARLADWPVAGEHARFSNARAIWVCEAVRTASGVIASVDQFWVDRTQGVFVKNDTLWSGSPMALPSKHAEFYPAVQAAVRKLKCARCRHLHFALMTSHQPES